MKIFYSTLFYLSTGYKANVLIRSASKCSGLSKELLQVYYSPRGTLQQGNKPQEFVMLPRFPKFQQ